MQMIEQMIYAIQQQSSLISTLTISNYLLSFSILIVMIVVWNMNKRILELEKLQNQPMVLDTDKAFRILLKLDQDK